MPHKNSLIIGRIRPFSHVPVYDNLQFPLVFGHNNF